MAPNTSMVLETFGPQLENSESFVPQSKILKVLTSEV